MSLDIPGAFRSKEITNKWISSDGKNYRTATHHALGELGIHKSTDIYIIPDYACHTTPPHTRPKDIRSVSRMCWQLDKVPRILLCRQLRSAIPVLLHWSRGRCVELLFAGHFHWKPVLGCRLGLRTFLISVGEEGCNEKSDQNDRDANTSSDFCSVVG